MKKFIKKRLVLLLIILLMTTTSFSSTISNKIEKDTIVSITSSQLKETNLIFAEHHKLLIENQLLSEQINNYKEDNILLIKADSVRVSQIETYKNWNKYVTKKYNDERKKVLFWKVGGIVVSFSLLLLLLVK